jgi:glycosyltransferase involved in cell wall biosynthesis
MKKVAIIGTVGLPANYGGFETLASHIVSNLNDKYDFTVYCSSKKYKKNQRQSTFKGAKLKYLPFNANGIQSIIYDSVSIFHALFYADVLIILGVAGAWMLPFVKLFTNKRIIISIDGIEWKRDKWNRVAKMYLWFAEKLAVKYSHIDISDNESIQDYTAMRYGSLSRIIEYGGDHVEYVESTRNDHENYPFLKYLYAVKVCRIEPENNVHLVLEAFTKIKNRYLVIVGNWDNSQYGKDLKQNYSNIENIYLLDPIYDQRTLDLIRGHAILYIHGHCAGGTNPSLVEAMNLSLPVLAYRVSYNKTTTENQAHYFSTSDDITSFILSTSMEKLKSNALIMKSIADRRYKWSIIAEKYELLISEALVVEEKSTINPKLAMEFSNEVLQKLQLGHLKYNYHFFEKRK